MSEKILRNGGDLRRILDDPNRLLMTLVWLRKYPDFNSLNMLFDVSEQTALRVTREMTGVLWDTLTGEIRWPSEEEWNTMRNVWNTFQNGVGTIDGTVNIPGIRYQVFLFLAHRKSRTFLLHYGHSITDIGHRTNTRRRSALPGSPCQEGGGQ